MNRRTFLTYAGATVAATYAPTSAAVAPTALDAQLDTLMAEYEVPGLSLATVKDGKVDRFTTRGIANTATGNPVTPATVFEAASLTKPMLAQAALKLSEEGHLDLDRPLVEYHQPNFECRKPERLLVMTATHVLSHTTGFPNWPAPGKPVTIRFDPGTRFSYSGMGYVVLQRVIEHITETPFETYLQENLFDPLNMESASLVWREDYEDRLAHGHSPKGEPSRGAMPQAIAASSLICTAEDYAKFIASTMNPATTGPLHLKPDTLDMMLRPKSEAAPNIAWCLGWGIQETEPHPSYWHWGNNGTSTGSR